jgi:hypothetical protein
MTSTADLAELKVGDFSSHLDELFDMQGPGGKIALRLVKAEPAGQSMRAGGAFSLVFVALGIIEIFLVPIGPMQGGGNGYQAVFT